MQAELAYCVPLGISYSHFLGGPAMWTSDDRDYVLAHTIRENERCPKCHQFGHKWQDPESKQPIHPAPLDIVAWYCEPCARWEREQKNVPEDTPGVRLKFRVPEPPPEDAPEPVDQPEPTL